MEDMAARLKRLRKEAGLTQAQLAARAKVTQGTIGNIESGMRGYGKSLVDIARALATSPEVLLGEPGAPDRPFDVIAVTDGRVQGFEVKAVTKQVESPMPGIDFAKVAALSRDDRLRLEGAWLDTASRLHLDVAAAPEARAGNKKAA